MPKGKNKTPKGKNKMLSGKGARGPRTPRVASARPKPPARRRTARRGMAGGAAWNDAVASAWSNAKRAAQVVADGAATVARSDAVAAAWTSAKDAARAVAGATADAARRKSEELADFVRNAPSKAVKATLYMAEKGRRLSNRVARGIQKTLLSHAELEQKMKEEYDTALNRLLKVQSWLEIHASDWLRKQVENPAGKHSHVRVRPEDVRSLQPSGQRAGSTHMSPARASPKHASPKRTEEQRYVADEPESKEADEPRADRSPAAFCAKFHCGTDDLKTCRKKKLLQWHPDKNASADGKTRIKNEKRIRRLNSWTREVSRHPLWREHKCVQ
jgi:hypothetical protein